MTKRIRRKMKQMLNEEKIYAEMRKKWEALEFTTDDIVTLHEYELAKRRQMKPVIGLDLDGVIRHNNKSLGTGDIPIEKRNKKDLLELYQKGLLPKGYYCTKPEDVIFIDGALEALRMFHEQGWDCYVISNQEVVSLLIYSGVFVEKKHAQQVECEIGGKFLRLKLDMDYAIAKSGGLIKHWLFCPHMPEDNCTCRKPKPGMLLELETWYGVPLHETYYIGDNPSDMEAGKRAGCKTIHIVLPTAESEFRQSEFADETAGSLLEVAKRLVARHKDK